MIVARSGLLRITSLRLLNATLALLGSLLLCATDSAKEAEDGVEETPQGGYAHKEEEQKQKAQTTEETHRKILRIESPTSHPDHSDAFVHRWYRRHG